MILQARTARPSIVLQGVDYYEKLAPYFLTLSYTDNCDGEKADDLQLQLADRDRKFINEWKPDVGAFIDVSIITDNWFAPFGGLTLDCGRFWIDSIDFELPQHTVSVKATSLPTDAHLKSSKESRGWEGSDLQTIAQQIAGENEMELDFQSDVNPKYERVEQNEQNALRFLKERANDVGLSIKVCRGKLIFFDEADYEAKGASFTLAYGNTAGTYRMTGGQFSTKITDAMKAAQIAHMNASTGRLVKEKYECKDGELPDNWENNLATDPDYEPDEGEESGGNGGSRTRSRSRVIRVNGHEYVPPPDNLPSNWNNSDPSDNSGKGAGGKGAAGRKAKASVRDANKDKETATIELSIGNPLIASGQTFQLVGVGQFDGKWFIESARHTVGPQFTTSLGVRRCLEGY